MPASPKTLKQKIADVDKLVEDYLSHIYDDDIKEKLSMRYEEIRNLTPENGFEIVLQLSTYNFHVQKAINKNLARLKFVESELDRVLGDLSDQYGSLFWGEKKLVIVAKNEYAAKVYDEMTRFRILDIALSHHTLHIKNIVDDIKRICYMKKDKVNE